MAGIRLDKYLADAGAGTRSQVKEKIRKGKVTVNGQPAKKPELKVDPASDVVEVRGVEPLSESTSVRLSPGADRSLSFPPLQVKGQTCRFSSFIMHGARKA